VSPAGLLLFGSFSRKRTFNAFSSLSRHKQRHRIVSPAGLLLFGSFSRKRTFNAFGSFSGNSLKLFSPRSTNDIKSRRATLFGSFLEKEQHLSCSF
jgi:hypothetical protein